MLAFVVYQQGWLGIQFRDITTMLADPVAFNDCMEGLIKGVEDLEFDAVAGTLFKLGNEIYSFLVRN